MWCSAKGVLVLWASTLALLGSTGGCIYGEVAQGRVARVPLQLVAFDLLLLAFTAFATAQWWRSRRASQSATGVDRTTLRK